MFTEHNKRIYNLTWISTDFQLSHIHLFHNVSYLLIKIKRNFHKSFIYVYILTIYFEDFLIKYL